VSDFTKSVVYELNRLEGAWVFRGWGVTIARYLDTGKWFVGMRHKRRKVWSIEFLLPDGSPTEIAQQIIAKAEEVTGGKG
jgi:hypothetical protein